MKNSKEKISDQPVDSCKRSSVNQMVEWTNILSHQSNSQGVRPLYDQVASFRDFPQPATQRKLREFLGLVNSLSPIARATIYFPEPTVPNKHYNGMTKPHKHSQISSKQLPMLHTLWWMHLRQHRSSPLTRN